MRKDRHVTAFYLETLLLILVFIGIILVLTRVFALGKIQSTRAKLLTNAVCLAENAAEAVSASDSAASVAMLLDEGGNTRLLADGSVQADYDAAMRPVTGREPGLCLRVTWEPSPGDERFVASTVTVLHGAETVYELRTAVLLKEAAP
ncbi:MAG: hypothetical protein IJ594_01120 [Oscillospiraceae bacterium]|nr:hypothetical protein [Oscillospiraceae bacterium]